MQVNYQYLLENLTGEIHDKLIKRLPDNAFIPFVEGNTDYQAYLKWLDGYERQGYEWVKTSDGNTPLPADEGNE
jgi:hypothetical protein